MDEHSSSAYMLNTGWVAGPYGVGYRIPLKENRLSIDAIFNGSLDKGVFETLPFFNLQIPKAVAGMDPKLLNPRNSWTDKQAYDLQAARLAQMFINNFKLFTDTPHGRALVAAGPQLEREIELPPQPVAVGGGD